jgi:ferredoxin--NADP+ reductase
VQNVSGTVIQGLYVVGWIKRGPNGIIGTNRLCAVDTAKAILADFRVSGPSCAKVARRAALLSALNSAPKQIVDLAGWRKIDAVERAIGSARDKPREKLTSIPAMLETARGHDAPWSEALGHMGAAEGGR